MRVRSLLGLARSVVIYGAPWRQPRLRRFYRRFVASGDLVFDVGAHVGDRSVAFAALGARVIALEPQPGPYRYLCWRLRSAARVEVRAEALGDTPGRARLAISDRHPTLATLSREWREGIGVRNPDFSQVEWGSGVEVRVTTLDALIAKYGIPAFCKIDVEGHEAAVLGGLSQPLPALSFEFVAGGEAVALACLDRLDALGRYCYNLAPGERRRLMFDDWVSAGAIAQWIRQNASEVGSGDVYARLGRYRESNE